MDEAVRQLVRTRAGDRCEYCRLPQHAGALIRIHVEHIRPKQHGGNSDASNLALACPNCNWNKGPNLSAVDPESGSVVLLFHPSVDTWDQHFAAANLQIVGLTPTGRATVSPMRMNAPDRIEVRHELARRGELDAGG